MIRAVYDGGNSPSEPSTQKQTMYWCSALVAYIYVSLGFLPETTPWTMIFPKQFSVECDSLKFQNCELGDEILIHNENDISENNNNNTLIKNNDTHTLSINYTNNLSQLRSMCNWLLSSIMPSLFAVNGS
jgi:hypothetical protein